MNLQIWTNGAHESHFILSEPRESQRRNPAQVDSWPTGRVDDGQSAHATIGSRR